MILRILDCSQYIYAGSYKNSTIARGVRESDGVYKENDAPIGGVRFLINSAAKLCNDNTVVIPVFDSTPTIKREMYKEYFGDEYGYKGTRRAADNSIGLQKRYAYSIMEKIGYPVQIAEGYEADDIIYTLVNMYKNDFEHIYVHNNDSDLYFLVSGNVSIDRVGDNVGKLITTANYSHVVDKRGYVAYNVHHIKKLCEGDKSDNIPGVGVAWEPLLDSVIPASELCNLGDLDLCRDYIKKAIMKYPTTPNAHMLLKTFNMLTPLLVPDYMLNDIESDVDWEKQRYFVHGWKPDEDRWGFEEDLLEYIDSYYE